MRFTLFLILFAFNVTSIAQSNEIGVRPFKLERNSFTFNGRPEPKLFTSVYYKKHWEKMSWKTAIDFGYNRIIDDCNRCADHIAGVGIMRELNFYTGPSFEKYKPIGDSKLNFSAALLFYGGYKTYAGRNFTGGFGGGVYPTDLRLLGVGAELNLGIGFVTDKNWILQLEYGYRIAKSKIVRPENAFYSHRKTRGIIMPQFSIGKLF